jgi:hypothetical protein
LQPIPANSRYLDASHTVLIKSHRKFVIYVAVFFLGEHPTDSHGNWVRHLIIAHRHLRDKKEVFFFTLKYKIYTIVMKLYCIHKSHRKFVIYVAVFFLDEHPTDSHGNWVRHLIITTKIDTYKKSANKFLFMSRSHFMLQLSIICTFSLWSLHALISIIKQLAWY